MTFMSTIANEAKDAASTSTGISFKKSFTPTKSVGRKTVGFSDSAFQYVDKRYKVVIQNNKYIVNAWLQNDFQFNVTSSWGDLLGTASSSYEKVMDFVNQFSKPFTGATMKNVAMTRRKWTGSSPLSAQLVLKFRTYDDADVEVVQAVHALQSMCVPEEMKAPNNEGVIIPGFLIAPGPNEYYATEGIASAMSQVFGDSDQAKQALLGTGDVISVDLFGGGFYLDMVVINRVFVKFDSKMTAKGPVAAEVTVNLESYEMLTKDKLDKAYSGAGYMSTKTPTVDLGKINVVKDMSGK